MPGEKDTDLELDDEIETGGEGEDDEGVENDLDESSEDGGEAESDEDGGEAEEVGQKPKKALSRGEKRIQALRKETQDRDKEHKATTSRLEKEIERLRDQRLQPQMSREEAEQRERELLAVMTPEERSERRLEKAMEEMRSTAQRMSVQNADALDQAQYNAKAAADPRYRKYESEVTQRVQELRNQGQYVTREAVLKFIIGEKVLAKQASAEKQRSDGKKRIARQTSKTLNGRGDVGSNRGKDLSLAKRLENVQI